MVTSGSVDKKQYDHNNVAAGYKLYENGFTMNKLEFELIRTALGDCTGLKILDLGGGLGTHARQAIEAGADFVHVVDISESMIEIGKGIAAQAGLEGRIRWNVADATIPLAEQGVTGVLGPGAYDVVMANWVFDHANTEDDLRGMWANIASSLKPGGKFLGVRCVSSGFNADHVSNGKYGVKFDDFKEIPGGARCTIIILNDPPTIFESTTMADSYNMTNDIPKGLGMIDFEIVPAEKAEVIKSDPEFWKEYLEAPHFAVVTAKRG